MKRIIELQVAVANFNGTPLGQGTRCRNCGHINPPSQVLTKELLLRYCSEYQGTDQKDYFLANHIGQKIWNCQKNELELEDAEFDFLVREVGKQPKFTTLAMMNIYKSLGIKSPYNEVAK